MLARRIEGARGRRARTRGFSARLKGAGLWDLVQMECLARAHRTVQVTGEGGVGYLYFDRGHIMHASTAQGDGEAAAIEILGWTNGTFQTSDRPWPEQRTIDTSHEGLILQAAKLRDEGQRPRTWWRSRRAAAAAAQDETEVFEELELSEIDEEGEQHHARLGMDEAVPTPKNGSQSGRTEVAPATSRCDAARPRRGAPQPRRERGSRRDDRLRPPTPAADGRAPGARAVLGGRVQLRRRAAASSSRTTAARPWRCARARSANFQTLRERLGL